jgi:hypothetical protein
VPDGQRPNRASQEGSCVPETLSVDNVPRALRSPHLRRMDAGLPRSGCRNRRGTPNVHLSEDSHGPGASTSSRPITTARPRLDRVLSCASPTSVSLGDPPVNPRSQANSRFVPGVRGKVRVMAGNTDFPRLLPVVTGARPPTLGRESRPLFSVSPCQGPGFGRRDPTALPRLEPFGLHSDRPRGGQKWSR